MENNKYNQLLTNLELWADTLATRGPRRLWTKSWEKCTTQ